VVTQRHDVGPFFVVAIRKIPLGRLHGDRDPAAVANLLGHRLLGGFEVERYLSAEEGNDRRQAGREMRLASVMVGSVPPRPVAHRARRSAGAFPGPHARRICRPRRRAMLAAASADPPGCRSSASAREAPWHSPPIRGGAGHQHVAFVDHGPAFAVVPAHVERDGVGRGRSLSHRQPWCRPTPCGRPRPPACGMQEAPARH